MQARRLQHIPHGHPINARGFHGDGTHLSLINPEHYKAVRGKKTDLKDGQRIAELLQDGRAWKAVSFLPPSSGFSAIFAGGKIGSTNSPANAGCKQYYFSYRMAAASPS